MTKNGGARSFKLACFAPIFPVNKALRYALGGKQSSAAHCLKDCYAARLMSFTGFLPGLFVVCLIVHSSVVTMGNSLGKLP
jgi:hypothetical protein